MNRQLLVLAAVASVAVTVVHVRASQYAYRLQEELEYDDVYYVDDAGHRLEQLFRDGTPRLAMGLWTEPPASPYQTAMGMAGLAAFGLHDASPYLANGLLVFLGALLLLWLFRGESAWLQALVLAFFLTSSFAEHSVLEFRPDMACGLATAAFVFTFLRGTLRGRAGEVRLSGVLFALALLAKPHFFPHTLVLGAWCGALYLAFRRLAREQVIAWREVGWAAVLALVLAGPYYLRTAAEQFQYFWVNSRSTALFLFDPHLGFWAVLYRYALARTFGLSIIGYHAWVNIALCLAALAIFARQRRWSELLLVGSLVSSALVSLLVITAGRLENEFFAATFHAVLLLTAMESLATFAHDVPPRLRTALGASFAAVTLLVVMVTPWARRPPSAPEVARAVSANAGIVEAIRSDARGRGVRIDQRDPVIVQVTATGVVNPHTLEWEALKRHLEVGAFDDLRAPDVETIAAGARRADYVVVPNPVKAGVVRAVPAPQLLPQLLARLRSDPRFAAVPYPAPDDPDRYFLFANRTRFDARVDSLVFGGGRVAIAGGFLPEEGPYPQWDLLRVRWLSGPTGRLCLQDAAAGDKVEVLSQIRAAVHGSLRALLDGKPVAEARLDPAADFQGFNFSFVSAERAPCLQLAVEGGRGQERRVLFRGIRVRINGE